MMRKKKEVSTFASHPNYWKLLLRKGDDKIDIQIFIILNFLWVICINTMQHNTKHEHYKSNQTTISE